jgi:hypothetical protein
VRTAALRSLVLGLGILLTRASAFTGGLPDLSGTWKLDPAQSDDPQQAIRESGGGPGAAPDSGDGTPPPSGSGGWGGHHGGGHGSGRGRRGADGGSGGGSSWLEGRERLVILHADPKLQITDAAGKEHTVYTDGRKTEEERSFGGTTEVRAVWKDGHVEITSQPEKGPKIVQTFSVSADGSQLTVTTRIEARRAFTIRSVYDAVGKEPATAEPEAPGEVEVTRAGAAGAR